MTGSLRAPVLWAVGIAAPAIGLAAWWVASAQSTNPFFPPLEEILLRFQQLWLFRHFGSDIVPSLLNLTLGFLLAAVLGIGLGLLLASVRVVRSMFEGPLHFLRAVPPVAIIPILISLIGFGTDMRIASITIAAVFPTLIATMDGIRSVDPAVREVCAAYRLRTSERILRVELPAAGPRIFAGLQVSLQVAFVVMIASEMLGSSQGIGAMTLIAQQSFLLTDMWAGILLLGLIGFLANVLFDAVRRRVLAWYIGSQALERTA